MQYFRMELDTVQLSVCILICRYRTVVGVRNGTEACTHFRNIIKMTHPAQCMLRHIGKQTGCCIHGNFCFSIFSIVGSFYLAAQNMLHQLCAIAQPQNGDAHFKQFLTICRSTLFITAVGTSG